MKGEALQHLRDLAAAGYKHGYTNGHGADDTVSGLEWALSHLRGRDDQPAAEVAEMYSRTAASNLESRLFAAYVLRALAFIKLGKLDEAWIEYGKAAELAKLTRQSHGLIPSLTDEQLRETMALVSSQLPKYADPSQK